MAILPSPGEVLSAFSRLDNSARQTVLNHLDRSGVLHAIKERVRAEAQQQISLLAARVVQLQTANAELRRLRTVRLTRAERKQRIRYLSEQLFKAPEIARIMTSEGEPISAVAVRQALSRSRRSK